MRLLLDDGIMMIFLTFVYVLGSILFQLLLRICYMKQNALKQESSSYSVYLLKWPKPVLLKHYSPGNLDKMQALILLPVHGLGWSQSLRFKQAPMRYHAAEEKNNTLHYKDLTFLLITPAGLFIIHSICSFWQSWPGIVFPCLLVL